MTPNYFDYNATTPIHPEIKALVPDWMEVFGNPSSLHGLGKRSNSLLEGARKSILDSLGLVGYHIVFTSGGTESNHLAFEFLYHTHVGKRKKVLISSIEHPCIEKQEKPLRNLGYEVLKIPVSKDGYVDIDFIRENIKESIFVSIMSANNETGVIQDVKTISQICSKEDVYFHCDTTQSFGKMKIDLSEIDADSYTISSHKVYGLKGSGAFVYRTKPFPIFKGGLQEKGLRAGTENLLGILSLSKVMEILNTNLEEYLKIQTDNRNILESGLISMGIEIVGKDSNRLLNTTCILLKNIPNDKSLFNLDKLGISISKGAACHSGVWEPSPILLSMGYDRDVADTSLRISTGIFTTKEEVEYLLEGLGKLLSN
ncbi:MAG: cysteine desulfurase [Leptospiraceae bacterium]|nr:cysteine desulfurase [Leptospiraceae bacterium]